MLKIAIPATERSIQVLNDASQTIASRSTRLCPDRVFKPFKTFLSHPAFTGFEPVAEKLKALPGLLTIPYMRLVGV